MTRRKSRTKRGVDLASTSASEIACIQFPQAQDEPRNERARRYKLHRPNQYDLPSVRRNVAYGDQHVHECVYQDAVRRRSS